MASEDPSSLYHLRATTDNKIRKAQNHNELDNRN